MRNNKMLGTQPMASNETYLRENIVESFNASLDERVRRAEQVELAHIIPLHWFSSAASECVSMFVAGHFYGCISVSQAYVEALSKFLLTHHGKKVVKDIPLRWDRLCEFGIITEAAKSAAKDIYSDRNDFHHLNAQVEQDYSTLEYRAAACINDINTIEKEVFDVTFLAGKIVPAKPEYWPVRDSEHVLVNLRQRW